MNYQERIFTDVSGEQLIVRHRKSAVFFLRETDLNIDGYVSPYWTDKTPVVHPNEVTRSYIFTEQGFSDFVDYMKKIAVESWGSFNAKGADSIGADYNEYYDKDFDNNGSLRIGKNRISLEGPYQPKTTDKIIRLYKFNKRKFESFFYDLIKK